VQVCSLHREDDGLPRSGEATYSLWPDDRHERSASLLLIEVRYFGFERGERRSEVLLLRIIDHALLRTRQSLGTLDDGPNLRHGIGAEGVGRKLGQEGVKSLYG